MAPRLRHLFLLFFLSGISGLVYESLWSRYLRLFVGSASTAQILVLALFMGGMSAGAFWAGRRTATLRRPILAYAIVEGCIGAFALAFPFLFSWATRLCYDFVFPAVGGSGVVVVKWTVAALLVAPPCILLGTTFPLMSVGILRRAPKRSGEVLSLLYFSNSLGASLGAVLSGFLLVPTLGLPNTLAVASALNIAIMFVAARERGADPPVNPTPSRNEPASPASKALLRLMLVIALGTGLSSFLYEVSWIRLLSMVLGSATHSFEVMLSAFVFGLAVGGFWVRKRMDAFTVPERALAYVQIIMGIAAIGTLPLYRVAVWLMSPVAAVEERTMLMWVVFNGVRYLLCLLIMFPATFCAGMTLPLATHVLLRRGHPESSVGRVYGINTLGAIGGAVLGGLVLMPLIGLHRVIILGAAIDLALGVGILQRTQTDARRVRIPIAVGAAIVILVSLVVIRPDPAVLAAGVFRRGSVHIPETRVPLLHVDGRTATVTVLGDSERPSYRSIYTNGKPDASVWTERYPEDRDPADGPRVTSDEPTQILCGAIATMSHPDPKRAAVIGIGSGVSSHVMLGAPGLERLDTIEIEAEMVEGAKLFSPVNDRTFHDPRSHIIVDDAKAYFAGAGAEYDLIVSEPSNPWVSGVSSLFTVEFYREAKRYMAPGGLLGQWMHGYELGDELLLTILAALDREFDHYRIYRIGELDWLLLASRDGPVPAIPAARLSAWPKMRAELEVLGIHDTGQLDALAVADEGLLHPYLVGVQPNRDAYPILDNGAEKARFFRYSAEFLHKLRFFPLPTSVAMTGIERRPYPKVGVPEGWENQQVLAEPERALQNARAFERGDGEGASAYAMQLYVREKGKLADAGDSEVPWELWFKSTFMVYAQMSPWLDLREHTWWADVQTTIADPRCPENVRSAVELLDAAIRRDAAGLEAKARNELERGDSLLADEFLSLAGAIGLALGDANAEDRHRYVREHMNQYANGDSSLELAFRVVRAHLDR